MKRKDEEHAQFCTYQSQLATYHSIQAGFPPVQVYETRFYDYRASLFVHQLKSEYHIHGHILIITYSCSILDLSHNLTTIIHVPMSVL